MADDKPKPEAIVVDLPAGDTVPKKGLIKRLSKVKAVPTPAELAEAQSNAAKRKSELAAQNVMKPKQAHPDSEDSKAAKAQCEDDHEGTKAFKKDGLKQIVGDVIDVDLPKKKKKAPQGLIKRLSKEKAAPRSEEEIQKAQDAAAARKTKLSDEHGVMKTDLELAKERKLTDEAKASKAKAAGDTAGQKAFKTSDKTKGGDVGKDRYCVISFGQSKGYIMEECPTSEDHTEWWRAYKKRQASILYVSVDGGATWKKTSTHGHWGKSDIHKNRNKYLPKFGVRPQSAGDGIVKADLTNLKLVFKSFCQQRPNANDKHMTSGKFSKFCKDSKLIDTKKGFTKNDVSLAFNNCKTKGTNVITYKQFQQALRDIGAKKYPSSGKKEAYAKVVKIAKDASPKATGATKSQKQKGKLAQGTGSVRSGGRQEVTLDLGSNEDGLSKVFTAFSRLGGTSDGTTMNGSNFSKFCRDAGLGNEVSAGIAFTAAAGKGKKTIEFEKFPLAISKMVGNADGAFDNAIRDIVTKNIEPAVSGTSAEKIGNLATTCGVYASGGGSNVDASKDFSALADRGVRVDARGVPITQAKSSGRVEAKKQKKDLKINHTLSDQEKEGLKQVFVAFCQFGSKNDPGEAMSCVKFDKFCVDSKLLDNKFRANEISVVFASSTNVGQKKITLSQFVNALKVITGKKYPEEDDHTTKFQSVITDACNAVPFEVGTTDAEELRGKLNSNTGALRAANEEEEIKLDEAASKAFSDAFTTFSQVDGGANDGTMNFTQFSKFSKDAGLGDGKMLAIAFNSAAGQGNNTITFNEFPKAIRKLFPKDDIATVLKKAVPKAKLAQRVLSGVSVVDEGLDNFEKTTGNVKAQKEVEVIKLAERDVAGVKATFEQFSKVGGTSDGTTMNVSQFSKFSRDAGLSDERIAGTAFTAAAGKGKTITFNEFPKAIRLLFPEDNVATALSEEVIKKTKNASPKHDGTAKAENQGRLEEKVGVYARGGGSNRDKDKDLSALANRGVKTDARGVAISQSHH